jgi:hypothetical protein
MPVRVQAQGGEMKYYEQLTYGEQDFVRQCMRDILTAAAFDRIALGGLDDFERALDALARLIVKGKAQHAKA